MTISRVQAKAIDGTGTSIQITLDAAPAQNNYLIAFVAQQGSRTLTPASGWSEIAVPLTNADTGAWYIKKCGAGESATQTPCTTDSSSAVWILIMAERSGLAASSVLEASPAGNTDNDATKTSTGSADPTDGAERLIMGAAFTTSNGTWSAQKVNGSTTGVTEVGDRGAGSSTNQTSGTLWDKIEASTSAGAYTVEAVASTTGSGGVFIAILKAATTLGATIGLASETDSALAIGRRKVRTISLAEETDSALAIGRRKVRTVGLATETEEALPIGRRKVRAIGLVAETDQALAITPAHGRQLGQATETDQALAIGRQKRAPVTTVTETEEALPIGRRKVRAIGPAVETDQALAIQDGSGTTIEAEIGLASETDQALAIGRRKVRAVGLAEEADQALAIGRRKVQAIGQIAETDQALAIGRRKVQAIGPAVETEEALAIGRRKVRAIGLVAEADQAILITPAHGRQLGQATETDQALAIGRRKVRAIGPAVEMDLALAIGSGIEIGAARDIYQTERRRTHRTEDRSVDQTDRRKATEL